MLNNIIWWKIHFHFAIIERKWFYSIPYTYMEEVGGRLGEVAGAAETAAKFAPTKCIHMNI